MWLFDGQCGVKSLTENLSGQDKGTDENIVASFARSTVFADGRKKRETAADLNFKDKNNVFAMTLKYKNVKMIHFFRKNIFRKK